VWCAGDFLYIPRGFPHEATTILLDASTDHTVSLGNDNNNASSNTDASLHVTFGLESAVHTSYCILVHHAIDVLNTLHDESNNTTDTCQCSGYAAVEALHELVDSSTVAVASLRRQVDMMSSSLHSDADSNIEGSYRKFTQCVDDLIKHYSTTMAASGPNVCTVNTGDYTQKRLATATTVAAVDSSNIAHHQQQQQEQQQQCMLCQLQQLRDVQPSVYTAAVHAMQTEFDLKQAAWLSDVQRNLQLCKQPQVLIDG
jgi:hypothetical protein